MSLTKSISEPKRKGGYPPCPWNVPTISVERRNPQFVALNVKPQLAQRCGVDRKGVSMPEVAATQDVPKRRVERRRRSEVVKLRLLPREAELLRIAVAESGFPSIQAYLLAKLPEIAAAPDSLQ
jgi:hypothetical protein